MAAPVLIGGKWRTACGTDSFRAENPATRERLPEEYPVSAWNDCEAALEAAARAFKVLGEMPTDSISRFLELYATAIEGRANELAAIAHAETGLPILPRLKDIELARTTDQLRQAAAACGKDRGRCRPSTPRINCGVVTRRLARCACLDRTIFRLPTKALPGEILPRRLRLAIR